MPTYSLPIARLRRITSFAIITYAIVFAASPLVAAPEARQIAAIRTEHGELRRRYAETLGEIASTFNEMGALESATEAWQLAVPPDPERVTANQLPSKVMPQIPLTLPHEERNALLRLQQAREAQSNKLYLLSRRALTAGSVQYAYKLLREAAYQDPDNSNARTVLGFVRVGDEWRTPFEARMRRTNHIWHDRFGWILAAHKDRYEAGERYYQGRWISAEHDAELHRDFSNPWIIRTEHYLVKTNHSLERGAEVASRLETFHRFLVETLPGFFARPEDLKAIFFLGTSNRSLESTPYEVHYYRTRDEYNKRLVSKIKEIEITNGLYYTRDRIAYFFHDDQLTLDDTLYHEATHQIMYESLPRPREVASEAHFWIVEGIACYMESFRADHNGEISLGDARHPRILAARQRYLVDKYYIPLGKFASMGLHQFQNVPLPEMRRNYSQASGLAHFFMHYDNGRYREALIEHLAQLYHGLGPSRGAAQNLAELTKVSYAQLDREYGEYIQSLGTPHATAAAGE